MVILRFLGYKYELSIWFLNIDKQNEVFKGLKNKFKLDLFGYGRLSLIIKIYIY